MGLTNKNYDIPNAVLSPHFEGPLLDTLHEMVTYDQHLYNDSTRVLY